MKLEYLDEYIVNKNGIKCHVLDVEKLDFSHALDAIKSEPTIVLRANGNEVINTIINGLVESSYETCEGDAIFQNSEEDRYVPRDLNGNAFKYDNLREYGYVDVLEEFIYNEYKAKKVVNNRKNKVLYQVIEEPTVIKNKFGEHNHQFLFSGSSLVKDNKTNKIRGVAKIPFNDTYRIINKIVITSGKKYIDIDAYGAIFAYKKLLRSLGMDAYAISSSPLNESISPLIKDLGFEFDSLDDFSNTKFIVLDVSNPEFFDESVRVEDIIEVIDHHVGYSDYWNSQNVKCDIEFIGSVCTTIYEYIINNKKEDILDKSICKLLLAGILDNTIDLKSSNTTERDIIAYNELMRIGNIEELWVHEYFESCYKDPDNNLEEYLINDIKIENVSPLLPTVIGQLIVLDINTVFNNIDIINKVFSEYDKWMINIISIFDGVSYLFASDLEVLNNLNSLFKGTIKDNYLILDKCILRKEIMKIAKEKSNN